MFSNNHAKFHAFITKVNNSALFWSLAAGLCIRVRVFCVLLNFKGVTTRDALILLLEKVLNDECVQRLACQSYL